MPSVWHFSPQGECLAILRDEVRVNALGGSKQETRSVDHRVVAEPSLETPRRFALVEQSAVVLGLTYDPDMVRGRDVIWFEDNSVVLAGLCRGMNHGEDLDAGTAVIHLLTAQMKMRMWYEYVESDSNWSDGASRKGEQDPWIQKHHFTVVRATIPTWPWMAPSDQRLEWVTRVTST